MGLQFNPTKAQSVLASRTDEAEAMKKAARVAVQAEHKLHRDGGPAGGDAENRGDVELRCEMAPQRSRFSRGTVKLVGTGEIVN